MSNSPSVNRKPVKQGLYDFRNEHDACGVGFVANIKNIKSHDIVEKGLEILVRLTHRGAAGADPREGDGAGILLQIPHQFFEAVTADLDFQLPAEGEYGVGMVFFPQDKAYRKACQEIIEQTVADEGQTLLGWRDVPVDSVRADLPESVTSCEPVIRQFFVARGDNCADQDTFERKLFVIRKVVSNSVAALGMKDGANFYIVSFSSRTIVYKGMFLSHQVAAYYEDLADARMTSALALVHQRFSTNTFPSWELAHPFRMMAHNGEINTVRGNINWMNARRHSMKSELLGADLDKLWPISQEGQSDTACFDNALELLVAGGYSLAHAAMLMIPEAWAGNKLMDEQRRAFYEHHAALMEPWDGPAAVAFTDGRQIGATLDRNGLRPARYLVTDDDLVLGASEMGVLDIPEERIVKKWRLQPGKMLLIDLEAGRIIDDAEIKQQLASAKPYQEWLAKTQIQLENLPEEVAPQAPDRETMLHRQQSFGYTQEDIKFLMTPMAVSGQEGTGSMGNDSPLTVLSNRAKPFYNYFRQLFAQVTNPPIDPIREEMVMSLTSIIGPRPNLLGLEESEPQLRLEVHQPILSNVDVEKIRHIDQYTDNRFRTITLCSCYTIDQGAAGMEAAIEDLCKQAEKAVNDRYNIIILSDRKMDAQHIAIPALIATSAVHHHLIRKGLRTETGLVVETGSAREVHHFACLAGFGAEAINPYLAFETLVDMKRHGQLPEDLSEQEIETRYIKAIGKGLFKVMSKMGISTYQSYCGAQIFEAVGLASDFVEKYFTGTATQIEGAGLAEVAQEATQRHIDAFRGVMIYKDALDVGGDYAWRARGDDHTLTPEVIAKVQHAIRTSNYSLYKEYADSINNQAGKLKTLRGLFKFKDSNPISIDEVEPAAEIVKRFATGAMSFGSISHEAHSTLAIAMNRIGGKSNTGEGGEEPARFKPMANGDSMRSAIKQVASGRFGVTTEYLANSDQIQIKMAQGAKPGEGGQLPGHKVDKRIGRVRHSTPGVGLISPPPHHDIYSIEDLAQLIFDLKNTNPVADISVKLVSEIGVGTVAAGVVKAHADHVVIAGHDGGTGASPLTSIKHAGSAWELGLAETQQTLVLNRLRGRTILQADGQMRTGRDVVIAALLGADEVAFGTIALIAEGCIMMRKCHLNTCPVGVATQDPELRKKFVGKPEDVVNFFMYVAEEAREIMAELGFRTFDEMIGRSDLLDTNEAIKHWKSKGLDLSPIFHQVDANGTSVYHTEKQDHGLDKLIDNKLIEQAQPALENGTPVVIETPICNVDRSFGTMLSGQVAKRYGHAGLPEDTIAIKAKGIAGQSLGAWLTRGVSIDLAGEGNDYVGKGLSGGRIAIYPPANSKIIAEENIIVGNTVLFGAIAGECYFRGVGGERFAVRNSGAVAVVEGVGDHCCEYMTGGTIVVLGETGRNFAAGMSGGIAYVLDRDGTFENRCNMAQVALEPVASEADALEELDHQGADLETHGRVDIKHGLSQNDQKILRTLIQRHVHYTNSAVGKRILENWNDYLGQFVKVMPVEYRRALAEMEAEKAAEKEQANG
ncbi:glutamate synthase (NADH) large subunit [Mariprofundus ferrinatatus]|uniref:Glutamate synthase [NADPH] large chain n=1 Tax=Mariprofundus ferrinatatus TaxID=1921087 RepID=A0A2K8L7T1_9PROT|nr:glutamate synthase large subunit [Mariprofundus ferrinatatus]ATX81931.1 glutamate synthase (NADH) large subunit [Mariprofundus ferrinatatus]